MSRKADALANLLGIDPMAVSKRLAFAKGSAFEYIWHIVDLSLATDTGDGLAVLALHGGTPIEKYRAVDSLNAVEIISGFARIGLCAQCADEFRNAADLIQADPNLAFINFYTMFEKSLKGK